MLEKSKSKLTVLASNTTIVIQNEVLVQLQEQGFADESKEHEQMNMLLLGTSNYCSCCYVVVDTDDSTHDMAFGDRMSSNDGTVPRSSVPFLMYFACPRP
jgi:hypothetical protein